MNIDVNNPLEIVGAVLTVGLPTTGAVFILCRGFVRRWLDHTFAKQLASLKAEQDASLKHIQSSIDHQIHRAKKLYDTEFEVLTKAWNMLGVLRGHVVDTTRLAPLYAEWDNATAEAIRSVLDADTDFTEDEKTQVIEADDPVSEFRVAYSQRRVRVYQAASMEFGHYLDSNGIFMRPEIREKFERLLILITLCFGEFASNIRRDRPVNEHYMNLHTEGKILRGEIRALIEGRLWSAAATREPIRR